MKRFVLIEYEVSAADSREVARYDLSELGGAVENFLMEQGIIAGSLIDDENLADYFRRRRGES